MTTGNGVPPASDNREVIHAPDSGGRERSSQLRDIEELVAKLQIVTKQLEFPAKTMPAQPHPCAELTQDMKSVSWG